MHFAADQTNTLQDTTKAYYQADETAQNILNQMEQQRQQIVGGHNNVWGNGTAYSGHASAAATDISSDPLFVDEYFNDWHLQDGSPSLTASASGGEIGAYGNGGTPPAYALPSSTTPTTAGTLAGNERWSGEVEVTGTVTVLGNSIVGTFSLGIDLEDDGLVESNDVLDTDSGPNGLLNFPEVVSATEVDGVVTVDFSLDVPAGDYRVEFFSNPSGADPSGFGEGEVFVGATTLTHAGAGAQGFGVQISGSAGDVLTATTTEDLGAGSYGATSEFSAAYTVTAAGALVSDVSRQRGDLTPAGGASSAAGAGVAGTGLDVGAGTERFTGFGRDIVGSELTVEGWLRLSSAGSAPRLVSKSAVGSGAPAVFEVFVESGEAVGRVHVGGSTVEVRGGTISTATWHYVAATWNGTVVSPIPYTTHGTNPERRRALADFFPGSRGWASTLNVFIS